MNAQMVEIIEKANLQKILYDLPQDGMRLRNRAVFDLYRDNGESTPNLGRYEQNKNGLKCIHMSH